MDAQMVESLSSYIVDDALVLIPVLWIIGYFLKQSPKIPDWVIVWVLVVIGIVGSVSLLGFTSKAFIQGVLVCGASVLGHQMTKQKPNKE